MSEVTTPAGTARRTRVLRTVALSLLSILSVLLILELFNQGLFFLKYKTFVWSGIEMFNVRDFTERVGDQRYVTIKPNYRREFTAAEGWGDKAWSLSTDAWGFRKGTHETNPACPNVGFIGASVPFGWGVSDNASLPSKTFNLLKAAADSRCVFSATIPSNALAQTVARYEIEILGKFKVHTLVMQVYDPVSQLMALGSDWQPEANWTNFPNYGFQLESQSLERYSATLTIINNALRSWGWKSSRPSFLDLFSPDDSATLQRFRMAVRKDLERLHELATKAGVQRLIVAGIAVPKKTRAAPSFSEGRRVAIDTFNGELRAFAAAHSMTAYADTQSVLDLHPDEEMYVDECCHLSESGNSVVAQTLMPLVGTFVQGQQ